jgi:hypothetical protein
MAEKYQIKITIELPESLTCECRTLAHGIEQVTEEAPVGDRKEGTTMKTLRYALAILKEAVTHPTQDSIFTIKDGKMNVARHSTKEFYSTPSLHA